MSRAILCLTVGTLLFSLCNGQTSAPDVDKYLTMIQNGQTEQVRQELPTLLSRYPNDPGVLYIQGMATSDGAEAVRIYQSIVDNFPKSEWADDALYKVYQFYYAIGLYRTAEMKLKQLRTDYPDSKLLAQSSAVETRRLAEENQPVATDTATPDTEQQRSVATLPKVEPQAQFTLQVGAYTAQVNAEKQKLFFEDLGLPVEVINKVKQNRSLYIVLVGNYATYDEAKARGAEFKKKYGIDSIVVSK